MARNRRNNSSAAAPAEPAAVRSARRYAMRPRLAAALLGALTVAMLSVSFAPFDVWPFAYVALAPFLLAMDSGCSRRWELLCGWLAGLVFWAANLYWLWWVTLVGYAALTIYLSAYWLVAAAVLRAAVRRRWPMWLTLPIVWVALEYARAYVISGLPWFFLAHSQYAQIELIQITDFTGQYGVSFFVAMVNGAVADTLLALLATPRPSRGRRARRVITAMAACGIAFGGLLGYGYWRMAQFEEATQPGPVIGIVQQAFPISLSGRSATEEKIFTDHFAATQRFVDAGCDLVIWPETMLPIGLNPEMLQLDVDSLAPADLRALGWQFFGPHSQQYSLSQIAGTIDVWRDGADLEGGQRLIGTREFADRVGGISAEMGCPLLAGGSTIHHNPSPLNDRDRWLVRNSALWFDGGPLPTAQYAKMHLVPFSEYVPFKHFWTGLYRTLRKFVPEVMEQLDPGPAPEVFPLERGKNSWRLAAPICYEGTFARICRQLVMRDGRKQVDILTNLSNDGWFVYQWGDGPYRGSTEHAQHLVQYCFRAVENRVPVVRAVNTGISGSIDSAGRIVAEVGITVEGHTEREMVPGTLLLSDATENGNYPSAVGPQVLVDRRVSVYSLAGDVFAMAVSALAVALTGVLAWRGRREKRQGLRQEKLSE